MKKVLSLAIVVIMLLTVFAGCAENPQPTDSSYAESSTAETAESTTDAGSRTAEFKSMGTRTVTLMEYISSFRKDVEFTVFNGNENVLYLEFDDVIELMADAFDCIGDDGYCLQGCYSEIDGHEVYLLERESTNGSYAIFDFVDNTVSISNIDKMNARSFQICGGDTISETGIATDEDGNEYVRYLQRVGVEDWFIRDGMGIQINLNDYNIIMYYADEKGYIPVSTFFDIFGTRTGITFSYGGKYAVITNGPYNRLNTDDDNKSLYDYVYEAEAGERPQDIAEYTYYELCLNLDINYGLKTEHGIEFFDDFFMSVGLDDRLKSTDPYEAYEALTELAYGYLGDIHTTIEGNSGYAGEDYELPYTDEKGNLVIKNHSVSEEMSIKQMRLFYNARRKTDITDEYGAIVKFYEEVGDTAYITFDEFTMSSYDYYNPSAKNYIDIIYQYSTIGLVIYANKMITRENSPVKNVVIDLSNNFGGAVDAAVYMLSWIMGTAEVNYTNSDLGSMYTCKYRADVNLDGKITDEDHLDLTKYNVFCLVNNNSFSCGNFLPCMLDASLTATILGQPTGGGACTVTRGALADGTLLYFSSQKKFCTIKNGVFYSVDKGIAPDFYIYNPDNFYDREWLTSYIDSLK